ncbi:hypothetical protein ACH4TC_18530 [Streptomyces spororaveus]|uniref:hypothetical protein n=1 Tax=Streptomyces spororaveus TaxID=284039 RepID=UPI0037BAD87D
MPTEPPQAPATPRRRPRWLLPAATALVVGIAAAGTAYTVASGDGKNGTAASPSAPVSGEEWKDCIAESQKAKTPNLTLEAGIAIKLMSVTCQGTSVRVKLTAENGASQSQDITAKVLITIGTGCIQQTTVKFSAKSDEKDSGPVVSTGYATATYLGNDCTRSGGFKVDVMEMTHNVPGQPATPSPSPTPTPNPTPSPSPTKTEFKESDFKELDDREFKKLARDPAAHLGESFKVYGKITQFDSATGKNYFRANIGPERLAASKSYDFDTNAYFMGVSTDLEDVVEDDLVELYVHCLGAKTYSTTIGGSQTVPWFTVVKVKRYATAS